MGLGMGTGVGVEVVVVFEFRTRLLLGEVVVFDFFELDHFGRVEGLWDLDAVLQMQWERVVVVVLGVYDGLV